MVVRLVCECEVASSLSVTCPCMYGKILSQKTCYVITGQHLLRDSYQVTRTPGLSKGLNFNVLI